MIKSVEGVFYKTDCGVSEGDEFYQVVRIHDFELDKQNFRVEVFHGFAGTPPTDPESTYSFTVGTAADNLISQVVAEIEARGFSLYTPAFHGDKVSKHPEAPGRLNHALRFRFSWAEISELAITLRVRPSGIAARVRYPPVPSIEQVSMRASSLEADNRPIRALNERVDQHPIEFDMGISIPPTSFALEDGPFTVAAKARLR